MSFAKELSIANEIEEFLEEDARKLSLKILGRLIIETPVDTGAARMNWLTSVNAPDDTVRTDGSADQTRNEGFSKIQGASKFHSIYIQNNLPYIVPLNEGWSQQAPTKFVDRIVEQEVRGAN